MALFTINFQKIVIFVAIRIHITFHITETIIIFLFHIAWICVILTFMELLKTFVEKRNHYVH